MKELSESISGMGNTLFLIFLVLKLCKVIDWSWWWVTAPLWILGALALLILIVGLLILLIYRIKERHSNKKFKILN